jgi:hypothetical protein
MSSHGRVNSVPATHMDRDVLTSRVVASISDHIYISHITCVEEFHSESLISFLLYMQIIHVIFYY